MLKFEKGETVCLKSGGPPMTVESIENGMVTCIWFEGEYKRSAFHEETLIAHSDDNITPEEAIKIAAYLNKPSI